MTNKDIIKILQTMVITIIENKEYLTDLDRPIGDSDHGINMARGFEAVGKKLPELEDQDIGSILKAVGMTLVSTVGGSSGPLYGTAFMRAGAAVAGKTEIDKEDFLAILDACIGGIITRGKATIGEKTMLDAIIPARNAYAAELESTGNGSAAVDKAILAAQEGCEYTKTIIATKGRASYLGERGIGHQDPGATSALLLLQCVQAGLK